MILKWFCEAGDCQRQHDRNSIKVSNMKEISISRWKLNLHKNDKKKLTEIELLWNKINVTYDIAFFRIGTVRNLQIEENELVFWGL